MQRVVLALFPFALAGAAGLAVGQKADQSAHRPTGWIGVYVENTAQGSPVILSVEPGSPAEKGGLTAGDTVLSYDAADPRKDASALRRLLQPGRHIQIRVRHKGVRTLEVIVGRRPADEPRVTTLLSLVPGSGDSNRPGALKGLSMGGVIGCLQLDVASTDVQEGVGLTLSSMNGDLAKALHVPEAGVLVLQVRSGTPAMQAGLKGGDVILLADSSRVDTPDTFLATLRNETTQQDGRVVLRILRQGKPRMLTLRW